LPDRDIVFVGDSSFAVHDLAHAITSRAPLISRLRPDAQDPEHGQIHDGLWWAGSFEFS